MWRGDKVELTAVQREDLLKYVAWLNDWSVSQFLAPGIPMPLNIEDETEWFENRRKSKENFVFGIRTHAGQLIGNCGLHNVDLKNRTATFGIFIGDKNFWNQGYGADATRTLLRFAFEQLGLNRVQLWVYDFNPRAQRAYEKCGFKRVGVRRQGVFRDGTFHDEILMDILRAEWDALARSAR